MKTKLRLYLDSLPRGGGVKMGRALRIGHVYLCQLASGRRRASPEMAARIERYTRGAVSAVDLRPDLARIFRRRDR